MKQKWIRIVSAWLAVLLCTLSVSAIPDTLMPGGCTIGVKLYTQGPVITGFESGSAAKAAGLRKGDMIIKADGGEVRSAAELRKCLDGERVILTVLRNGKEASFCVKPNENTIGAYVKDSIAGIGTVTYYDPETGAFGALGHGVCDAGTEKLIPVGAGVVVPSVVSGIEKGVGGKPGELKGEFDVETILGEVTNNTECGIFGTLRKPLQNRLLPVAQQEEITIGQATILANINGKKIDCYEIEIEKIFTGSDQSDRNLLLRITDQNLLSSTGGIVQGMSGSPIIQDGKLVGAVTHVLVNDPTRGYGIFIENMLDAAR